MAIHGNFQTGEGRGADTFHTWNPVLRFDLLKGPFTDAELSERTLKLTITDNARKYDEIEWELDNRDGKMTQPQFIALGLMLRIRYGYDALTSRWRSFIISRMKGGVGVYGRERAAVGSGESTITFTGRNRNAPDLKRKRGKRGASGYEKVPTGKGGKGRRRRFPGGSTADVTQSENLFRNDGLHYLKDTDVPRVFNVRHLSDAVREIAKRMGYPDSKIFIEPTDDEVTSIVIPAGVKYAEFLHMKKKDYGWMFKATGDGFHFHPEHWTKERKKLKEIFVYGAGRDILSLSIDADFRLPIPNKVSAVSYTPLRRATVVGEIGSQRSSVTDPLAHIHVLDDTKKVRAPSGSTARSRHLRQKEERYVTAAGATGRAGAKATKRFIDRNMRALTLSITITGNPRIYAGDTIGVTGTGTPLVDHEWYVSTAKHIFSGTTYVTELELKTPRKGKGKGVIMLHRGHGVDRTGANRGGGSSQFNTYRLADEPISPILSKSKAFTNARRGKK
jgi:hypothetical protein